MIRLLAKIVARYRILKAELNSAVVDELCHANHEHRDYAEFVIGCRLCDAQRKSA